MQKILIAISCIWLVACGSLQFPGVYKLAIEQGNVVTQEMVDKLKPGMSKSQVEFIMGSPLIKDSFNSDRWDYVYSLRQSDQERKQQRLTVFFKEGKLSHFSGDFVPSGATATPI